MKLPRYPKYKDSGVEWLGEVPEHWEVWKLSHTFGQIGSGTTPKSENVSYYEGGETPWLNTGDLNDGELFDCEKRVTDVALRDNTSLKLYPSGSLVIAMYGATIGKLAMLRFATTVNQACCVFSSPIQLNPGFMFHWLYGFRQQIVNLATGGGQPNISQEILRSLRVPSPDIQEQFAIAAFLDRETDKIDALVEEQRRLIELLKEKRQAVISHAVTKGLNPDAPMKDSGIEWLGEVPSHWDVKRIKYVIRKLEQGWSPQCENFPAEDGEWAVLKVGCVNGGNFNPDENKALPLELTPIPELGICVGDVLISRANTRELAGSTAMAKSDYPRLLLCDKLYRLRLRIEACLPEYLTMFLSTPSARGEIELSATGASSSMVNIGQSTITEMLMPLPPIGEQERIATFVNDETGKADQLIAEATHAIDLLQERRTALISAAVTGKIDVRGEVAASLATAKAYSRGFARQLLAAEILYQCCEYPTTGRVKLQKLIHLCEYVAEIDEIHADYLREAAGPFDNKLMFGVATGLAKQKWYAEVRDGNRTFYRPLEKASEHKKYLARWEDRLPRIHQVLKLLGKAQTQQCEITSTLYAAWNDLLIEGRDPSDMEIIHEASDPVRWHENKAKIPPDKWPRALKWMRDNGLVPTGYGSHTKHRVVPSPDKSGCRPLRKEEIV
jgi:type I restriction enzyme S subunit